MNKAVAACSDENPMNKAVAVCSDENPTGQMIEILGIENFESISPEKWFVNLCGPVTYSTEEKDE